MKVRTKSTLIVVGTLMIGMVLGALLTGTFLIHRLKSIQEMRTSAGLTEEILKVIEPSDATQEADIRHILNEKTVKIEDLRLRYTNEALDSIRFVIQELQDALNPILSIDQQNRLNSRIEQFQNRVDDQ